ncbi:adenine/guanine permease AZG1 [Cinnamomum micranthum f. kanehirae]|uniref:Adenine/guanine permease AZG1 n=1 Tax=Cinnamomum micranthum f. kanehirae TaxID=337451 RepID=A0A3S3M8K3_9MAGN|nr:adenine/guanine permease AZG1 [Cinnamomum micranthum f. kanehirae]
MEIENQNNNKLSLSTRWDSTLTRLNSSIAHSRLGKHFKLLDRNTTFTTELRAGTATFLTMAYILAANATILTDSGGPCSVSDCTPICSNPPSCTTTHLPDSSCKFPPVNPGYALCLQTTRRDLIVATAASSLLGCLIMGLFANLPLALAPGMGTNAYFAYTVVGFHGSGNLPYRTALAAVFLEGLLFLLISAVGLRAQLAKLVPKPCSDLLLRRNRTLPGLYRTPERTGNRACRVQPLHSRHHRCLPHLLTCFPRPCRNCR